jgi:hypothetical protein
LQKEDFSLFLKFIITKEEYTGVEAAAASSTVVRWRENVKKPATKHLNSSYENVLILNSKYWEVRLMEISASSKVLLRYVQRNI